MSNVYERVEKFYNEHKESELILSMDEVERYLRKKAWQGRKDRELRQQWDVVSVILTYILEQNLEGLFALTVYDYQEIMYRISEKQKGFSLKEAHVAGVLEFLENFYDFLDSPNAFHWKECLRDARESFYEDGCFSMPKRREAGDFYTTLEHMDEITAEDMDRLNFILDKLLHDIGEYFHQAEFVMDLTRAVALFGGPNYEHPADPDEAGQEAFWFSFWDYFLFDYHLLATDETPLRYFYTHEKKNLEPTEADIIRDLLKARFTVFYIENMDGDFVTCRNMFTDELIDLPAPDTFLPDYNKVILYGHIHARGVMLLNYITTVPASGLLRKRIKEEILRQFELFKYQETKATLEGFFLRQAAAVRHIIHILTDYAQLRVVPMKDCPAPIVQAEGLRERFAAAEKRLQESAWKLGFSSHGVELLTKLYRDFLTCSDLSDAIKRRTATLTAVLLVFAKANGAELQDISDGIGVLGADRSAVLRVMPKVQEAVGCIPFDPRYLTEEGFVHSLFFQQ